MTIKKWTYAVGLAAGLALVACTGENGQDGAPGADGTSCVAKALKDSTGFEILCGDEVVGTIKNGEDGEDGKKGDKGDKGDKGAKGDTGDKGEAGEDGDSCTVKPMEPSGFKVLCDGDSVGVLVNGVDGDAGADGKSAYELAVAAGFEGDSAAWLAALKGDQGVKGDTGVAGADGKSAYELAVEAGFEGDSAAWIASLKGAKGDKGDKGDTGDKGDKGDTGDAGESCVLTDNGDGTVTVSCNGATATLNKAMCGTSPYDPAVQFCASDAKVHALCHKEATGGSDLNKDGTYDVAAFFCDANDSLVALCDGETYVTATQFCASDAKVYPLCHNVTQLGDHNAVEASALEEDGTYDVTAYFCAANDSLYALCKGTKTYNPELQYCDATEGVQTLCGGKSYDLATQMCVNDQIDTAWACCQKTGVGDNWCKAESHWYDVRKEFCDNRDGTHYKYTTIAKKGAGTGDSYVATWMAENLNYSLNVPESEGRCREDNCETYGRFYTWEAAVSYCPDGWHLPTQAEYTALINAVGKRTTAFRDDGTNTSGFSALGGNFITSDGTLNSTSKICYFWSATEATAGSTSYRLYIGTLTTNIQATNESDQDAYLNVRCIKD